MEVTIPFNGFYETCWSDEFDNQLEYAIDSAKEEYPMLPEDEIAESFRKHYDFSVYTLEVSRAYVSAFVAWLKEEMEIDVTLTFKTVESPKEYNFCTDRIFADITLTDLKKLYEKADTQAIQKIATRRFTSRSGFISFYNPDITTWGDLETWDHNQAGTILEALVDEEDVTWAIFASLADSDDITSAFNDCLDFDAVQHDLDAIVPEDTDCRQYPRDTNNYVASFIKLNHLT